MVSYQDLTMSTTKDHCRVLGYEQDINPNGTPLDIVNFARFILANGTESEKRDLVISLGKVLFIKDRFITASPSELC
ncbi:MAG TPA: hypothetical protein DEV73_01830 [Candidatus Zambryskibacteria bacterium]|nr:hypothetical protein [Candidatus Zambryskibacteria bacterium]